MWKYMSPFSYMATISGKNALRKKRFVLVRVAPIREGIHLKGKQVLFCWACKNYSQTLEV